MAGIAYGSGGDPGLPAVDLPTFSGQPGTQAPMRIQMGNPAPQPGIGAFAPYSPPNGPDAQQNDVQQAGIGAFAPYQPPQPQNAPEMGGGEAALRSAAHGLTFGFYPAIAGAASAAKAAVSGGDAGDAYSQTRQQEEEAQQQAYQQHPYISTAADIAGNVPSLFVPGLGMGRAAMAATSSIPRIAQAIGTGAVAGGLFGAGEQTSKGGSLSDVALGAGGGALAGGALGGVLGSGIEGVTHVGSRVASIVRGNRDPEAEASRLVLNALKGDQGQVEKVMGDRAGRAAAAQAGTDVRIADVGGGNVRALTRAATNLSPEARDIVGETVGSRFTQQGDRVARFIRSHFGGIENDVGQEAIKAEARKQLAPAYKAAERQSDAMHPRGVWSDKLEQLLGSNSVPKALEAAIARGRDRAVAEGHGAFNPKVTFENGILKSNKSAGVREFPDLRLWDYTQRELRDMATAAQRAGRNEEADALFNLHRQLLGELDKQVPAFAAARGRAAAFFKAGDALEAGANFVRDTSISDRGAMKVLAKMSPAERELFKRGFAAELASKIERIGDNRNVLNSIFLNNGPARRRILIALGQEDAGRLEALLRIEGIVDRTRRNLGNSTTAQQLGDAGKIAGTFATLETLKGSINPVYLISAPLIWAGRHTAKQTDERVFAKVAEMLMSEDPAVLSRGINIAAKNPNVRTALRYASDMTGHQLVNLLGPSGVASAALTIGKHVRPSSHEAPQQHHDEQNDYQGQQAPP